MSLIRLSLCCVVLLAWATTAPVHSQETVTSPGRASLRGQSPDAASPPVMPQDYYYPEGGTPGYEPVPSASGYVPIDPFGTRFSFRSDVGDGPGWAQGFQSLNGFVPIVFEPDRSLLFVNGRAMVSNNGNFMGSAGAGLRWYSPEIDRVFGGSFWYDYDDSGYVAYDQFGISLESLGRYFDVRVNAYIPSSDKQRTVSNNFNGRVFFTNDNIGLGTTRIVESALRGGDMEIGGALPLLGDFGFRSYLGGYYFQGDGVETTFGVKYRSEVMITEDLHLGVGASSDKLFGQNVYGSVTFYLPDGRPQRIMSRQPVRERLYANVERNYRVNIFRESRRETVLSINPDTGLPYIVHHVDNNNAPGSGNGSVNNPFGTLSDAPPGADIIFVRSNAVDGGGNPILAGYDTGITLLDGQRLLGQGTEHLFTDLNYGIMTLPGNNGGPSPIITNPAGDVVTLANRNEVSGFQIGDASSGSGGNGIFGSGITDFNINRNTITNSSLAGISLINASGTGSITDNVLNSNTLENIIISNTAAAPLLVNIEDNDARGSFAGAVIRADASDITAQIASNDFSNNDSNGVELLSANGGTIDALLLDNVANTNGSNGFQATADAGVINMSMFNNSGNSNTADGLSLNTLNGGELNLEATDNAFSNNTGSGLNVLADNGTVNLVDFSFTTLNENSQFGMALNADNGGTINGSLTNNSLQTNLAGGLTSTLDNGSQSTLAISDTIVSGNTGFGMSFSALNGSVINNTLSNNQVDNNVGPGVQLNGSDSQVAFQMSNSDILNNQGIGFDSSIANSLSNISLLSNDFNANQDAGIRMVYSGNSTSTQLIDGNVIENTTDIGATATPNGQGILVALQGVGGAPNVSSTIQNNVIQNNASDGIQQTLNNGTGNMLVNDINNNNILANGRDGISMQLSASSNAVLNASNNLITTQSDTVTGVNGINLDLRADSQLTANISNNTIDGSSDGTNFSTGSGVLINVRQDATLNATLTANAIRQNGVDGVHVGPDPLEGVVNQYHASQETADINVTLNGNLIEENQDDGVQLSVAQVSEGAPGFTGNANYVLNGNTIRNNGTFDGTTRTGAGVNAEVRSGQMDLVMTNNTITGNAADGVLLRNSMGSAFDASIVNLANFDEDPNSILNAILDGNTISNNGNRGVAVKFEDLTANAAQMGAGARGNITLTNNIIDNNNDEGVYVLMNTQHDDNLDPGGWDFVDVPENVNGPTINAGNLAELNFTAVGNSITNNGGGNPADALGSVAGDGMFILVGTGSYVRADIRDNTFSGNFLDDFHTDSFVAGPQTPATAYNTPNDATSRVFLDRAARLDLRFTGNTGNSIGSVTSASGSSRIVSGVLKDGFFTTLDAEQEAPVAQQKSPFFGRFTDFFRVEDTPTPVGSVLNGTNSFTDADSQLPRNNFLNNGYILSPIGSLFP